MFRIEFPAWRRSTVVDGAIHAFADFPSQRHAARLGGVGTAHADDGRRDRDGHFPRHARPPGKSTAGQFGGVEVDPEGSAAGAAGLADVHGRLTRQRHSSWPEATYFFSKGVIGSSVS